MNTVMLLSVIVAGLLTGMYSVNAQMQNIPWNKWVCTSCSFILFHRILDETVVTTDNIQRECQAETSCVAVVPLSVMEQYFHSRFYNECIYWSKIWCRIWSWSPMPCEKHDPRDSVDKNRGRRPRFLSLLRPEGHVFHTAWETMIKSYYSMLTIDFFPCFLHIYMNFSALK